MIKNKLSKSKGMKSKIVVSQKLVKHIITIFASMLQSNV